MNKKILLADDDKELVEVLTERLEHSGYHVVSAYEGVRTIEVAHKERPDLIILDWKMPTGIGSFVLKDLKSKHDTRHIPVIILTGLDDSKIEEESLKLGATAFMKKPYDDKILLQKIREILEWKELEASLSKS
jgi:DNA-binding response OmpR family regulator